jgi:hypothetical protein
LDSDINFSLTLQNFSKSSVDVRHAVVNSVWQKNSRSASPPQSFVDSALDKLITTFALPFLTLEDYPQVRRHLAWGILRKGMDGKQTAPNTSMAQLFGS